MSSHGLLYSSNALTNELKQWKVNETTYSFWFKTYYIKTVVLAEGQIDIDQWNEIESSEIKLHIYDPLIFQKGYEANSMGKMVFVAMVQG